MNYLGYKLKEKQFAFSLIEILIVATVITILLSSLLISLKSFRSRADLNTESENLINSLRFAQSKTLASEGSLNYGIHFEASRYILFQGKTYSSTAPGNIVSSFPSDLEIYNISLSVWPDIFFNRITGTLNATQSGNIGLRQISDHSNLEQIILEPSGKASVFNSARTQLNTRISDSRHVHFNYSRIINTAAEKLTLTFDNSPGPNVTQDIILADYLSGGNISWTGTVSVDGQNQIIGISTHLLNDFVNGTIFSVHRDRRYNNKALSITISGDATGSPLGELIKYSAVGQETKGASSYVNQPIAQ